jgi:hypothetical protein
MFCHFLHCLPLTLSKTSDGQPGQSAGNCRRKSFRQILLIVLAVHGRRYLFIRFGRRQLFENQKRWPINRGRG